MVQNWDGVWVDIYLPSLGAGGKLVSKYNVTIADGGNGWHTYKFEQNFGVIAKRSISQVEFVVASLGSNQSTNILGSADPVTTGGHNDTANRRMVSNIGCEDMCGALWQWSRDAGGVQTAAAWANAYDANDTGVGGQHYQAPARALLGGNWDDAAVWFSCFDWICSSCSCALFRVVVRLSQWTYKKKIKLGLSIILTRFNDIQKLRAKLGGNWNNAAKCGSRASNWNNAPLNLNANYFRSWFS